MTLPEGINEGLRLSLFSNRSSCFCYQRRFLKPTASLTETSHKLKLNIILLYINAEIQTGKQIRQCNCFHYHASHYIYIHVLLIIGNVIFLHIIRTNKYHFRSVTPVEMLFKEERN